MTSRPSGIVTLTTDFGIQDPSVGILKAALLKASEKPKVVDLTHGVEPQDVAMGAFMLWTAINRFPAGTVHVGIVDARIGPDRQLLAVSAHNQFWLTPDNHIIGAVLAADPTSEVRSLDLKHLRLQRSAQTMDGRDLLAPTAAWLASGRYGFSAMGPRVDNTGQRDLVFAGEKRIIYVDRYGNLITNIAGPDWDGRALTCEGRLLPPLCADSEAAADQPIAYVGPFGLVEVTLANGNASRQLGLERGAPIGLPSE